MNRQISLKGRLRLFIMFIMTALLVFAAIGSLDSTASASYPGKSEGAPSVDEASKISPAVLQDTADGKSATFLVLMADQANVTTAYAMTNEDARGWYVYDTLRLHADRTQAGIRAMLQARGVTYKSYWISNALVVTGDRSLVESIAARADVSKIEANRPFKAIDPIKHTEVEPSIPLTIEWGVQNVRAPEVWAMGYTGQGIIVGNGDTGMRWTHNAIKNQYRGWNGATAEHNYNWWDGIRNPTPGNPCGIFPSREPCDDDELLGGGHGTHTTGSVLGDDGMGNQIGVAPGAKWIGCRNLDRGVGYPSSYLECFQFFLAPHDLDGNNPDPTRRPHVENNSWACVEGCAGDILRPAVENSQAAGIFIEVSAGNDGPACSTIAWEPQIFEASFDTGAINISNTLASFSSRGPVVRDGSGRLKPNVSAPGVNVRSSLRGSDTAYGNLSGTSMAGPHTVGVVALVWSARPDLSRRITETKTLLQQSANPNVIVTTRQTPDCGGTPPEQIPNNYFGWGRVDALAALQQGQATVTPMPTVTALPTFTVGTPAATRTPAPTFTIGTPLATFTAVPATTVVPTATRTATQVSATGTPTRCAMQFNDVPSTHTFYDAIRCLACRNIVSGYADGSFKPDNLVTRGQLAKIVSNSARFTEDPGPQLYQDVPSNHTFYEWINRLSRRGYMGGYPCGSPGEPCVNDRPYFRPVANATRAQTAKIVSNAALYNDPPSGQTFEDVPPTHPFYTEIQRLASRNVMGGYNCGGLGEPCVNNRPYFRPYNDVTRGQSAKIVANTFYHNCQP